MEGMTTTAPTGTAREYWTEAAFTGRLRQVPVPRPGPDEVLIETLASGISPGTESLVHRGEVPSEVAELIRAPHQLGQLPFPVSHGYLNVGTVREGPPELQDRRVFTLTGHRSHVVVPAEACHLLAEEIPTERALLAGVAEVGLNAVWEAQVTLGDRVAVVGAGLIGLVTGLLVSRVSPARIQLVDVDPSRRQAAEQLGLDAVPPEQTEGDHDVVFHTSSSEAGLATALRITGDDGQLVEMSWFGSRAPRVPLGEDFHARRLRVVAAQVGEVAAPKRLRRTRAQRLGTALGLLDERFDLLVTGSSPLERLPEVMNDLASGAEWTRQQLLHVVTYQGEDS